MKKIFFSYPSPKTHRKRERVVRVGEYKAPNKCPMGVVVVVTPRNSQSTPMYNPKEAFANIATGDVSEWQHHHFEALEHPGGH